MKSLKRILPFALILCMFVCLFSGTASAEGKKMVIGDTTFNAENWEETIDPHRTYNGWPCIRYGVGEPARRHQVLFRPRHGRRGCQAVL